MRRDVLRCPHVDGARLVTLVGAPGVGKTRLALELVLAGGAMLADSSPGIAITSTPALGSQQMSGDTFEREGLPAREYLCCALVYADPDQRQ